MSTAIKKHFIKMNLQSVKNTIDIRTFTKYRNELMGGAILWIFLFHCGDIGYPVYDAFRKYGWIGVDVFIFLSAIGLCYSLNKNADVNSFYSRRALRILPTWWIILFCVHILGLLCNHFLPKLPFHVPHSIPQILCWYSGLGYWLSDILPDAKKWCYEWYVPSLILLYIVAPWFYRQKVKVLIVAMVSTFIVSCFLSNNDILHGLRLSYQRVPVFIMGFLYYRMISSNWSKSSLVIILSWIIGIILLILNVYYDMGIPAIHIYQLLMPLFCVLFIWIIKGLRLNSLFHFWGGITLELYLIHLYKRPIYLLGLFIKNPVVVLLLTLLLCSVIAWLLHKIIMRITGKANFLQVAK